MGIQSGEPDQIQRAFSFFFPSRRPITLPIEALLTRCP